MKSQLEEQHTRLFAQCPALLGTRVPLLLLVVRAADRGRHPLAVQVCSIVANLLLLLFVCGSWRLRNSISDGLSL
jgi:hypothetical protein